ncbi:MULTISPECIES: late competence development ComFB family protein [unclassified Microcoleus]|uniref:late competence development ComFB family protein n=1 Tax=unclassified Microcoleus TaxID=2642155 RepID=UPI002FD4EF89
MQKNLVNITLAVVTEEVEIILESYPKYPYQEAFSPSGLRQDLIAYVLSRVPNRYTAIDSGESVPNQTVQFRCSSEQLLHIENLIHTGIREVLHSYEKIDYRLCEQLKSCSQFAS